MTTRALAGFQLVRDGEPGPARECWEHAQVNTAHFREHADELWKEHDGKLLLVYDGGTVEAFASPQELYERIAELPDNVRQSAKHFQQRQEGVWIL